MTDLTIIIVTWNSMADISRCLDSIQNAGTTGNVRTVVVDNRSSDGTPDAVARGFPFVHLVRNSGNTGFAAANNQALRSAESRYMLLLNPDTEVDPGAIDALIRFMDAHPQAWAAGPALLNGDRTPQRTGVKFPTLWNLAVETLFLDRLFPMSRLFGSHRELYADPTAARQVDYLQGSCLIVKKEAVERIGGLDEGFFMYFEETDWCFRMKEAGGEIWYTPDASVIHFGGGTFGHYDERRLVHFYTSLKRFFEKHHSPSGLLAVRLLILCRGIIRWIVWTMVSILKPGLRDRARSSAHGYMRVIHEAFR
jgi:N-acetylglucosaminyl-diphospho-decaprenol L-rhamnosyltransferase